MTLSEFKPTQSEEVVIFFQQTFTDSEGEEEGATIGQLVQNLLNTTEDQDLFGYCAMQSHRIQGCIFFSRFILPIEKPAFLLSPVAVATSDQSKGIGQKLIRFGLEELKAKGIELVFTYGDPNYYSKVGFEPIAESFIQPPYSLTHPQGWLAQSLSNTPLSPIQGESQCVYAFRKEEYW